MPLTELDKNTALVIIDLQRGVTGLQMIHPVQNIIDNAVELIRAFRQIPLPIVIVNVGLSPDGKDAIRTRNESKFKPAYQKGWNEIIPEIIVMSEDIYITKRNWNAFYGTELDLQLRRRGVTGLVMCGIATSIGVEGTARAAHERNYQLTFASDAMTDSNATAHENSLKVIFPRMGEIDTTQAIVDKLLA